MMSENKPDQTKDQKLIADVASYALSGIVSDACEAVKAEYHIPVCKIVKFFSQITDGFWDLGQNTPSSCSGECSAEFGDVGLGGNINSVAVQFYDPYNFPAVSIFENDYCAGQSTSFGVRNFTVIGTSTDPIVTEKPYAIYTNLGYPALNGNSIYIPWYTTAYFFNSGKLVQTLATTTNYYCMQPLNNKGQPQHPDFDEIHLVYTGQDTYDNIEGNLMLSTYSTCINTVGNTEAYCAAYDKCLEKNNNSTTICSGNIS